MTEHIEYIKEIYSWALRNLIVDSQKAFAKATGLSEPSLSAIIHDKNSRGLSGKGMAKKVKKWVDTNYPNRQNVSVADYNKGYQDALKERDNFDWLSFRRHTAKDIMCAVLSTPDMWAETKYDGLAAACIKQTDELIKQLKDEN